MWVDWKRFRPQITMTGSAAWPQGERYGWSGAVRDHDILFFKTGSGEITASNGRRIPVSPGTCLWLMPGDIYEGNQDPNDPITNHYIHFKLMDSDGSIRAHDEPKRPERIDNIDTASVEATFRRINTLLPYFSHDNRDGFTAERIEVAESILRGLLMDLDLATQHRQPDNAFGLPRHHSETVMRVLVDMQDRPEKYRSVQSLADQAGYSTGHFARMFRAVVGEWPEQFLIRLRIAQAKVLLTTSAMSINEIAETLGYSQTSFFSTQFRKKIGCSPREFRESRRSNAVH